MISVHVHVVVRVVAPVQCSRVMCVRVSLLQLVWDDTDEVGCAVVTCQQMIGLGPEFANSQYLVCNYGPA